jgi:hypothetical protein
MSVTLSERIEQTVDELGAAGRVRAALENWYAQRGERVDLTSESARLRALLDIADVTVREWALEMGYEHMAGWYNEQAAAERPAWRARRERSVARWAEPEA